jgi:hypothetical protein
LERYYEKYLYGDTCLYELPERPELHMLSTNLSEGCICSFTRSGLIMQKRLPGDRVQFERIQAGLATVPMAVTASSAFPGFFPPIKIRSTDIGASEAAFSKQTFTDGGVFDNLGIRAFKFIERCWSEECRPTEADGREMEVEEVGAGAHPSGEPTTRGGGHSLGRRVPAMAGRENGATSECRDLDPMNEAERAAAFQSDVRSLAAEVGDEGVTVNTVAPSLVRSKGTLEGPHEELGLFAQQFGSIFARVARERNVTYYPFLLEGVALDERYNQDDLIHPNAQGVRIIADRLAPVIARALRSAPAHA